MLLPAPLTAVVAIGVTAVLLILVIVYRSQADQQYRSLTYKWYRPAGVDDEQAERRARQARIDWGADDP
jgi:hypothetical protein